MKRLAKVNGFRYVLKHGFGPGTLPKDVEVISHTVDGYTDIVVINRRLTQSERDYYDITTPFEYSIEQSITSEFVETDVTIDDIQSNYHEVDKLTGEGGVYTLYEHNEAGDEEPFIVIADRSHSPNFFCYTRESLAYTLDHLMDEYTLYKL